MDTDGDPVLGLQAAIEPGRELKAFLSYGISR
jgi:hypothetical protein